MQQQLEDSTDIRKKIQLTIENKNEFKPSNLNYPRITNKSIQITYHVLKK